MSAAHTVATPGGFNMLVNIITAFEVWSKLTRAQKAALTAWPQTPSPRVLPGLRRWRLVDEDGALTKEGMFVCWAKFTDRRDEFTPEGGW